MSIKRNLITILLLFIFSLSLVAQEVKFSAKANNVVELNEQFRLSFTLNANGKGFKAPNLSAFNYSGPSSSSSSSTQFINGKMSRSIENSFVYFMQPKKTGKFTIGAAQITVDGKTYKTNAITIEVVKGSASNSNSGNSSSTNSTDTKASTSSKKGDIFVRVNLSKTSVYQGESLLASVKIYTRESLSGFNDIKMPSYQGFWSQEIPTANNIQLQKANYNGKVYNMGVLSKSLLFPQKTGKIVIESAKIDAAVRKATGQRTFWGQNYKQVSVKLQSTAKTVTVKPLPSGKPESFNGAVGNFTFSAQFDKTSLKANDASKLTITISGNGNLKLIDPIKVKFPPDFEVYDPQVKNSIKNTVGGAKGSTTIEYLVIPRIAGEFKVPAIKFSYFDPQKKRYITKTSDSFKFTIEKSDDEGDGTGAALNFTKKDVQMMGNDIRHIKENKFTIARVENYFYNSSLFYISYIAMFLLFVVVFVISRKQIQRNADVVSVKNRRANKVSKKRLKLASKFLNENKKAQFYDEILLALWGYVSNKLNIPQSELSRDNILETFKTKNIENTLSDKFIKVLDDCEFAKYSPAGEADMPQVYKSASEVIQSIEEKF